MQLSLLSSSSSSSSSSDFHHFSPQRFLQHRIDYLPQHWNSILADFCQAGSIISAISYEESASCPSESNIFLGVYEHRLRNITSIYKCDLSPDFEQSLLFNEVSRAGKKKKNRWKKDLMLARRAELWEWGARKVETHTFHAPHSQSSARCANINFFPFFFFFFNSFNLQDGPRRKAGTTYSLTYVKLIQ